ncbi:glycosyltransferase family A protein [Endozoicomonas euniceicola]|uniref:Glycosyltransferase family 2 protein n=1 Tax=Endozoicomonas euniceicola TaxID=1234143 RepID=A0ABY6GYW0_9GAMM|nr:glycosyltransferase family A protein [Endozoicomonas euniceicola]UYM17978.1 glycosyltransferase family 2 protein [Endozoicomonas euniceicola]
MNKPILSIIIPAYNYAHTLTRAVNSVIAQFNKDIEVIIINDGSTDNTENVTDKLKDKYQEKISIIHQTNKGLAGTRNRGIDASNGDYLLFLDADDELYENAVYYILSTVKDNPGIHSIIGQHISIYPDGKRKKRFKPALKNDIEARFKQYLLDENFPIANGSIAIHREVFKQYRYPEHLKCVEDIPVFTFILTNYSCIVINQPIALIHKHPDSMRNNIELELETGISNVDEIFSKNRLPEQLLKYKKIYTSLRYLSIFRTLYLGGRYKEALVFYKKSLTNNPAIIIKLSYLRKALKCFLFKTHSQLKKR